MTTIKKLAVLSVFDKSGISDIAKALIDAGYGIISTGGTAKALKKDGIQVKEAEDITGFPESFDGRVKTLHPKIHGGILYRRDNKKDVVDAKKLGILPIDFVICNLYPFEKTVQKSGVSQSEVIENIDIGGPTMVRAAAKNHQSVTVVVSSDDYGLVVNAIKSGGTTLDLRKKLAGKAFRHTAFYDSLVADYLDPEKFPRELTFAGRLVQPMRYGENLHQQAGWYMHPLTKTPLKNLINIADKQPSATNVMDIDVGLEAIRFFKEPAVVIIKHNNPCGIALGETVCEAFESAIDSDVESAFGGAVIFSRRFDSDCATIVEQFKLNRGQFDIIAAPSVDRNALARLRKVRPNTEVYEFGKISQGADQINIKMMTGGFIYQDADIKVDEGFKKWRVVTNKKPTASQLEQMRFAWNCLRRVHSNTIIVVDKKLKMTRGIGLGQTSRVRSTRLALDLAGKNVKDGILASDSFFPFEDSVELAAKYGIGAIIQQGGSIGDQRSIDAANKAGIPMVMTDTRAFWH